MKEVVEKVPGFETAQSDVVQVEYTVEAALAAGAHYLDTTGELD
ncbi:hypothetical protein AAGW05_16130 [Arthrobacter sp. LAPM80]